MDRTKIEDNLIKVEKDIQLDKAGLKRCTSLSVSDNKIGCIEEEIPDRLEMKVSSCGPDDLETDCVCEMVEQDKTTKQYVCHYQTNNGRTVMDRTQIENNLARMLKDTHLNKTGLKRCASLSVGGNRPGHVEEEMPDRLEMKVSSGRPDDQEMDCVCEMVDQDKSTKQYVCSYQMTNGATNRSEVTPPPTGQDDHSDTKTASIIEGKFALNLPYVNSFYRTIRLRCSTDL